MKPKGKKKKGISALKCEVNIVKKQNKKQTPELGAVCNEGI